MRLPAWPTYSMSQDVSCFLVFALVDCSWCLLPRRCLGLPSAAEAAPPAHPGTPLRLLHITRSFFDLLLVSSSGHCFLSLVPLSLGVAPAPHFPTSLQRCAWHLGSTHSQQNLLEDIRNILLAVTLGSPYLMASPTGSLASFYPD